MVKSDYGTNCRKHISPVYIPKRHTLIQVLPPANAYTKLFAPCSCIFTHPFVGPSCIYAIRPVCVPHGVRIGCLIAILWQNAYMHEQIIKEFDGRKYLYECKPFWVCKPVICITHFRLMYCRYRYHPW